MMGARRPSLAGRFGVLAGVSLGVGVLGLQARGQQVPVVLARLEARQAVALVDPATKAERRVYQTRARALTALTVSPNSRYLAVLEHEEASSGLFERHVVILTIEGTVVRRSAREAHRYTWCCGGSSVAYVAGRDNESDLGFAPKGLFILDVATGEERFIPGSERTYALRWAPFDSSFYLKSTRPLAVYRYSLQTGSLSPTPHRDFHFSPSGHYYLDYPDGDDRELRLRETQSDREVALPDPALMGVPGWAVDRGGHTEALRLVGWALETGDVLLFTRSKETGIGEAPPGGAQLARREPLEHILYDARSRRILRRFAGEIPEWSAPRGAIPIISKGRIDVIQNR